MADVQTKLEDLVNPQVLGPILGYELGKALRFTPLAQIDRTLVGKAGDTLSMPQYTYIGDASDIGEGEAIPTDKIGTSMTSATIKKIAKGTSFTDEAVLSGYGDIRGESSRQLGLAIANKMDNDVLDTALTGTQKVTIDQTVAGVQEALDIFNDEDPSQIVAIVSPKVAANIREDARKSGILGSDVGANALIAGTAFDILGVQVVRSRKLSDTQGVFVLASQTKPALKLILKRDVMIEPERKPQQQITNIFASQLYTAYKYYDANLVVATFNPKA